MQDYFQSLISNCASAWRPVPGYEGHYEASSDGSIRSTDRKISHPLHCGSKNLRGKTLSPCVGPNGYVYVSMCKNGVQKSRTAHRVVVESHRGAIPSGMDVDHINGDRSDNRLANLRVVTRSQNIRNKTETNNTHGHRGIYFSDKGRRKKWAARIKKNGKTIHVGCFMTLDEAVSARLASELKHWGDDAPSVVRS